MTTLPLEDNNDVYSEGYDYPKPSNPMRMPNEIEEFQPTTTELPDLDGPSLTLCDVCCRYPELAETFECPRCLCDNVIGFGVSTKCLKTLACG